MIYDKPKNIIFHDTDEELDDQTAIQKYIEYLANYSDKNHDIISREVYFVATNGVYKSHLNSDERNKVLFEYFPQYYKEYFPGIGHQLGDSVIHFINIEEASELKDMEFRMLQIAPLTGLNPEFFKNNKVISRVLMGEKLPTPSLNTNKSWCNNLDEERARILDEEFKAQNEFLKDIPTRYITTTFARKIPFSYDTINSLPEHFKTKIFDKVFKLLVGRVPPNLGFCENVTIGANHPTIMSYLKSFDLSLEDGVEKTIKMTNGKDLLVYPIIEEHCKQFIKNMKSCKDKEMMFEKLSDINKAVYLITDNLYENQYCINCHLIEDPKSTITFSADSIHNYSESYKRFMDLVAKYKPSLTPAYDVLAMYDFITNYEFTEDYIIPMSETDKYIKGIAML